MIPILCLVQEDQITPSVCQELKDNLNSLVTSLLNNEADITWIEVSKGNGFTARKPSRSSIVSLSANRPLSDDERLAAMKTICDLWTDKTGCTMNEIVAAVSDPIA